MVRKEVVVAEVQKLMDYLDNVRNIAIIAHVDHGKSTLTDSLIARAGLISKELAGEQRVMDFDEQEQTRGITIKSANISLGFQYQGKDYLINLIDTPGHVDFGGHVTRALRAVDGVVLVIDAVEGIMPQTEAVLRQAIKERAQPTVFINKVDRLINELKLEPQAMQQRFLKIIAGINKIIMMNAPHEFIDVWSIDVNKGNIAFGSAYNKWAVSVASMKRFNITFKDIIDKVQAGKHQFLVEKSPLDEVLLGMTVVHLPNPIKAQTYRIPVLWKGDVNSEAGREMLACNAKGKTIGICFGVVYDEHAGEVGVIRVFSGTIKKGDQLYVSSKKQFSKIQQIAIYMGPDRIPAEHISAGNIGAIIGVKDLYVGETISTEVITPFEQIKHYAEPVITKSIEAKESKNLARLVEILRSIKKEDPTLKIELNQETGEHLISGMGELHLEIIEYKIRNEKKLEIKTSPPVVVYRETIISQSPEVEGKSPNRHNKIKVVVEPLQPEIISAIEEGAILNGKPKTRETIDALIAAGMVRNEAKSIWDIYNKNVLIDATKGVQYLNEVEELITQGFEEAMDKGVLAKEKVTGVKITLTDVMLHEDNVHRGPAQMLPAIKRPIYAAMLMAGIILLEPKQKMTINVPQEYAGDVITLIQGKRGQLLDMQQDGEYTNIIVKMPVAELFGFGNDLRSVTQGRAIPYQEYAGYEIMPKELVAKVVKQIRERKGDKLEPLSPSDFID